MKEYDPIQFEEMTLGERTPDEVASELQQFTSRTILLDTLVSSVLEQNPGLTGWAVLGEQGEIDVYSDMDSMFSGLEKRGIELRTAAIQKIDPPQNLILSSENNS